MDVAVEQQRPVAVGGERLHEGVADEHRQVEVAQPRRVALGIDERFDIGVIDPQAAHHRPAPLTGRLDRAAHRVPAIHEAQRSRCVGADPQHRTSRGADGRKIHAHAAALLHRHRGFAQMAENAREGVGDGAHDKAVEQSHRAIGTGAGEDASGRDEAEIGQRCGETVLPIAAQLWRLGLGDGAGDAGNGRVDAAVALTIWCDEAVFGGPYLFRQRVFEPHQRSPAWASVPVAGCLDRSCSGWVDLPQTDSLQCAI